MKGRNHLRMGACTVAIVSAAGLIPFVQAPLAVAAGIGLFLFGKVAPDLDHPGSSITRSWGWASRLLSWALVRPTARLVYENTRGPGDPAGAAVHRGFTHTAPGAIVGGTLVFWCLLAGPAWAAVLLALTVGGAARVYDRGWQLWAAVGFGAIGYLAWDELLVSAPWLGFVLALGCYAHALDDCVTTAKAPLKFPRCNEHGQRWERVGPPDWLRFDTGGAGETAIVWAVIIATSGVVYWLTIEPYLGPTLARNFGSG